MTARSILKWTPLGFAMQMLLIVLVDAFVGVGNFSDTGYGPWIEIGESVLPIGSGGLAMSVGAIAGLLFGMFVYSVVVGAVLSLIREPSYN